MLLIEELIRKKRDGKALSGKEIRFFIEGVSKGSVSNSQIAALVMAIYIRGMSISEQSSLTLAKRDSGTVLTWKGLGGPVLDKHSTGGVGDLVSIVLGPLVAACGGYVPMISGRGLGHTGGTVDKLESIPGMNLCLTIEQFQNQVRDVGVAMMGQSAQLAPADRRFYAVRDVTATVSSIPLIVSSILSKKLAEGLNGLVMDIKCGNGAFMQNHKDARSLAMEINRVAGESGLPCRSLVSDMNQPLSWSAGNSLEVAEAIDFLTGQRRNARLEAVVLELAAEMLMIGKLADSRNAAATLAKIKLDSGAGAEKFAQMVTRQGGPVDIMDNTAKWLGRAPVLNPVFPESTGYISAINTRAVGFAVVHLGGGRQKPGDMIDPSVGLSGIRSIGQAVGPDSPLAMIHANNETDWQVAADLLKSAFLVSDECEQSGPLFMERIDEHSLGMN